MKKYFYAMLITILLLSGLLMSTVAVFSEPQEPNCVCAECNQKCGTGHASTCSSNPKK